MDTFSNAFATLVGWIVIVFSVVATLLPPALGWLLEALYRGARHWEEFQGTIKLGELYT